MRRIIIHRSELDEEVPYWVECPSLSIASRGESIGEAIRMIQEGIVLYLDDLAVHSDPVPPEYAAIFPIEEFIALLC